MKRILMFIGVLTLIAIVIISVVSASSKKLVCKSDQGNITLMYNDKKVVGYTAKGISYDLDTQGKLSEQKGIDVYLDEFMEWFSTNTNGTCKK